MGFACAHRVGYFARKPSDGFGCPDQHALRVLFLILLFPFGHISGACTPDTRMAEFGAADSR
jgi:hypothetical protein